MAILDAGKMVAGAVVEEKLPTPSWKIEFNEGPMTTPERPPGDPPTSALKPVSGGLEGLAQGASH